MRERKGLITISGLILSVLLSVSGYAETSVWKATKNGETVYFGGTVHLLRPTDYPLPEAYETAYQASDALYFETDIRGMSDMSVQARMLGQLTYQDGRTLTSVLSEDVYQQLRDYAESVGLPMAMMQTFKPGLLITTLQLLEFQKLGFTPQGVDAFFDSRAMGDGKSIGQFETVDEQIGFLSRMGEGIEDEFVALSLADMEKIEQSMDQMIQAWRSGDVNALEAQFVTDMKNNYPQVYKDLLLDRNNRWMPQVESLFKNEETEFVLVGAAHLVGEDGLIEQLAAKGYEVAQL
ncbi:MAG: TraB/GumN family protein [Pseudohongiellaceae bacterium]|nr:TraB/GumN family protein [Pseudohongiellaceae bacterium]